MNLSFKRLFLFIIFILAFLLIVERFLLNKNGRCYYGTQDIKVSSLLLINSDEKNINYCKLLRLAFKNDKSLRKFVSLQFYDGASIDHANIVYKVYRYYGSEVFWEKNKQLNKKEKKLVQEYLDYAISEKETFEKYGE